MKMTLENIVSVQGTLAQNYKRLDPATIQCANEITNDRRTDISLRDNWFGTANTVLYRIEDGGEVVLYFSRGDTSRKVNPIFKNIDEATDQLIRTNNYNPNKQDIETVVNSVDSGETRRFKYSDLGLTKYNNEFSFFKIKTSKYNNLNENQREFAEMCYGQGDDFKQNMKMLSDLRIKVTKVYVLNPDYVNDNIEEDSAIVRACRLYSFDQDSIFIAFGRDVGFPDLFLRGVEKTGTIQDTKNSTPSYTPEGILKYLQENPITDSEFASQLSNHVNKYFKK